MLLFVVEWVCGAECEDNHRLFVGTHGEALDLVAELQRGKALEISVSRLRVPNRKAAVLALLNDAFEGEAEVLLHLVAMDCEAEPAGELH